MSAGDIKALRERLGLTQAQFGTALGFTTAPQVRVSELERGKVEASPMVTRLCAYIERYGVLPETATA